MKKEILEKVCNSKKNLIVSGDKATGKTLSVLFPLVREIIEKKQSLLVLDTKEEYINEYYKDLISNNYNIIILNLCDFTKSNGWNPLEYPYNLYKKGKIDEATNYIERQANLMFSDNSTASKLYMGIVFGLFEDGREEEINLNSVNLMLNEIDDKIGNSNYLREYFKCKDSSSQSYIFVSNIFSVLKDTKDDIVSLVRQKLNSYVNSEILSVLLSKTTFNYTDVLTKPTAIFVITNEENEYINDIVTMFIDQLFTILVNSKNHNYFNFVLDNIDAWNNVQGLSNMFSLGISKNIKFEIATCSYEEFTKRYGNDIIKIRNLIEIENDIKLWVDSENYTDDIECLSLLAQKGNVLYPNLEKSAINTFDIKNFVLSKDIKCDSDNSLKPDDLNVARIDDLRQKIAKKIKELSAKEGFEDSDKD